MQKWVIEWPMCWLREKSVFEVVQKTLFDEYEDDKNIDDVPITDDFNHIIKDYKEQMKKSILWILGWVEYRWQTCNWWFL